MGSVATKTAKRRRQEEHPSSLPRGDCSASGNTAEGIPWIEQGIRDYRATGAVLSLQHFLGLKAEALYLAVRTSEAHEAINEAEALAESVEHRNYGAELHRLRGVFLTALGADEAQIWASFCTAIRIAQQQKSVSLAKRAEATYAEYRRQKASAQENVDSDCLFGSFSQLSAFRSVFAREILRRSPPSCQIQPYVSNENSVVGAVRG